MGFKVQYIPFCEERCSHSRRTMPNQSASSNSKASVPLRQSTVQGLDIVLNKSFSGALWRMKQMQVIMFFAWKIIYIFHIMIPRMILHERAVISLWEKNIYFYFLLFFKVLIHLPSTPCITLSFLVFSSSLQKNCLIQNIFLNNRRIWFGYVIKQNMFTEMSYRSHDIDVQKGLSIISSFMWS